MGKTKSRESSLTKHRSTFSNNCPQNKGLSFKFQTQRRGMRCSFKNSSFLDPLILRIIKTNFRFCDDGTLPSLNVTQAIAI